MFDSWSDFVIATCLIGLLLMGGCFIVQMVWDGAVMVANGVKWAIKKVQMWLYFRKKKER